VKLLHTSDWHVGKAIRGRSRIAEHEAVLAEIAELADRESVDLVLVGGDLFDSSSPAPDAERVVYDALLALTAERTRPVVAIAGNHDGAARLAAVAPVFAAHGVTILSKPTPAAAGGVLDVETARGAARLALLPFPSQRGVVTAEALMSKDAAEQGTTYAERVRRIVADLASSFDGSGAVNIVLAHLMVMGGTLGGGERGAHTIFDYWVPATAFPPTAHLVALGHLHRAQRLDGPCPIRYCGSPLQLDFGETANAPSVDIVVAEPGRPGVDVQTIALSAGRRLQVLRGTPDALQARDPEEFGDDHLKLVVESGPRPGLADDLRARFPNAVEVVLAALIDDGSGATSGGHGERRVGRPPHDLFADYLEEMSATDARVLALFDELVDEAMTAEPAG
jgi:exonuclease SbcD